MQLCEMSWPKVDALSRDLPVLIPIAAVEQHGHHLPLATDSMLLGEIVRRVEHELSPRFLLAPLQWYGNSHHHMDFPGTLSAPPRVYLDLVSGIVQNFIEHGFRRILLLNGHGGNDVPGKQVLFELRQEHRDRSDLLLVFATYWSLMQLPAGEDLQSTASRLGLQQTEMGHACEWETSMMRVIAPQLVGDFSSAEPLPPGHAFHPAARAWITRERSSVGHIGWPHLATPEKGEALLAMFSTGIQAMILRMCDWDGQSWEG